ncbi:hypothetical protein K474DRAFT_1655316 [Panus rudis PR-1116 ss-1]|nr:hypothetical protein K474DRAFT_1655316 [Panus rudis PR-1116 ss-1]
MPPRVQAKVYTLTLKTHKLTVFVTVPNGTLIKALKADVLSALNDPAFTTDTDLLPSEADLHDPEWQVPQVTSTDEFELCRAVKEKGRPTGKYSVLDENSTVKSSLVNWESVFVQFKDEEGALLPIKVSIPSLDDEEEEEVRPTAQSKGKRKARPDSDMEA